VKVIAKQTYRFKRSGKDDVVVKPSRIPETVPNDIAEDPIFALSVADGSLTALSILEPPAAAQESPADSPIAKPTIRAKKGNGT